MENGAVLRLIGIAISIGLADSLNPSTIAPALYLAAGERARERVSQFTFAVFAVYLIGGVAIALGPGQLLLSLVPHPRHHVAHIIETAVGVALIASGMILWRHRRGLAQREMPRVDPRGKSSWLLGAAITAVELPTAFPYFAAIAAIVGADVGLVQQVMLLVLFNVCFVLPLVGIVATLTLAGDQAQRLLAVGRDYLQRHWPTLLAGLAVAAGAFVVLLGATGFASGIHGRFGHFARRFRRIIHP
jgi:cytochrome c biogenesis protein CcdA